MLEELPAVLADAESPVNVCSLGYSADGDNGRSKGMTLWETEKNFRSRSGPEGKFKVSVEIAMEGCCKGEGRSGSSGLGCQVNTISVQVKAIFQRLISDLLHISSDVFLTLSGLYSSLSTTTRLNITPDSILSNCNSTECF